MGVVEPHRVDSRVTGLRGKASDQFFKLLELLQYLWSDLLT